MVTNKLINSLDLANQQFTEQEFIPVEDFSLNTTGKISRLNCLPFVSFNQSGVFGVNPPVSSGQNSVAIGLNFAVASENNSFQIGSGTNSKANSLQFLTNNFVDNNTINFKTISSLPTDPAPDGSIEINPITTQIYGRLGGQWRQLANKEVFIKYNPNIYSSNPAGYTLGHVAIGGDISLNNFDNGVKHLGLGSNLETVNNNSDGDYSSLIGSNCLGIPSNNSFAIGQNLDISNSSVYQLSVGPNNSLLPSGANMVTLGHDTSRGNGGTLSTTIGKSSHTTTTISRQMCIGHNTQADSTFSILIGENTYTLGQSAIVIGKNAQVPNNLTSGIALGVNSSCLSDRSTAIGLNSICTNSNSFVCGVGASVAANNSTALGTNATVSSTGFQAVQLGVGTNSEPRSVKFRDRIIAGSQGFVAQTILPGPTAIPGQVYITSSTICVHDGSGLYCAGLT
jgi:trimeric autotransporter adhesin